MSPFVPFFLFFSFISLKNFNHHGLRNHFPFVIPCGIWSVLDELWRILRLAQTRNPRRLWGREFAQPETFSNSGYSACCYWHTVLVIPQILDFSWEPVHHVTSIISQCDPALICIRPLVIRDPAILVTPSMTLSSLRPRPWPSP